MSGLTRFRQGPRSLRAPAPPAVPLRVRRRSALVRPSPPRGAWLVVTAAVLVGVLVAPAPAAGQVSCGSMSECPAVRPGIGLGQELRVAAANAVLGGATAVIGRIVRGESVREAVVHGALGGAAGGGLIYAGKRIGVEEFDGAGFVGRQVAGVGGSVVRNVTAGRGALEEVVLSAGPVRLYMSREQGVLPRVDLATLLVAGAFVVGHEARLDPGASLSAGALVFRGTAPMPGLSSAGAMLLWHELPAAEGPRLMAHERVHVLQYDQAFLSWGEPAERWLGRESSVSDALLRYVDFGGLVIGARAGLGLALEYGDRPWEHEAYFLAERAHPVVDHYGHGH